MRHPGVRVGRPLHRETHYRGSTLLLSATLSPKRKRRRRSPGMMVDARVVSIGYPHLLKRPRLDVPTCLASLNPGSAFGRGLFCRRWLRFASKPRSLRERRSLSRVVRCYHRIVWLQSPLFAVFVRSQPIVNRKMTFQRFEFLPVFQADDVVRGYRPFRIDGGFLLRRLGHIRLTKARKRRMDRRDKVWQSSDGQGVLADVGRDNVCRQPDQISRRGFVLIVSGVPGPRRNLGSRRSGCLAPEPPGFASADCWAATPRRNHRIVGFQPSLRQRWAEMLRRY